jgi:hypothetical protein
MISTRFSNFKIFVLFLKCKIPLITLASLHTATISLDSSLKSTAQKGRKKQDQIEDDNTFSHL